MNKNLTAINQSSKLTLSKSKNLLDMTKKLLKKKELIKSFHFKPFLIEKGHKESICSVVTTLDGKYIISGSYDQTLKIWDFKTGECLKTLEPHENDFVEIDISLDGKYIVSGGSEGIIKTWDFKTGECLDFLENCEDNERSVAMCPDAKYIVSSSYGSVKIFDIKTGECLNSFVTTEYNKHSISKDSRYLISYNNYPDPRANRSMKTWDFNTGECLNTLDGSGASVNSIAISPDGKYIVSGSFDETLKIWDFKTGECLKTLDGVGGSVNSIAISPDGKYIVLYNNEYAEDEFESHLKSELKILDFKTGECIHTLEKLNPTEEVEHRISSIAISSDGKYIVSNNNEFTVHWDHPSFIRSELKIWDLKTGEYLKIIEEIESRINSIDISPNGRYIVSGNFKGLIKILDFKSGECLNSFKADEYSVDSIVISPDGRYIVSGNSKRLIKIWDFNTGECLNTLEDHEDNIYSIVISPNSEYIVSVNFKGFIKIWDLKTGECLNTLKAHECSIYSIAISPDGKYIVSGSSDETLKIWDIKSGENLYTADNSYKVSIDNNGYYNGSNEDVENYLRISETVFSQRKLTNDELKHFRKKGNFLEIEEMVPKIKVEDIQIKKTSSNITLNSNEDFMPFVFYNSQEVYKHNKQLLTISNDNLIRFWDLNSRTLKKTILNEEFRKTGKLILSENFQHLVYYDEGLFYVLNTLENKLIKLKDHTYYEYCQDYVYPRLIKFINQDEFIYSIVPFFEYKAHYCQIVYKYNINSYTHTKLFTSEGVSAYFTKNYKYACYRENSTLKILDLNNGEIFKEFEYPPYTIGDYKNSFLYASDNMSRIQLYTEETPDPEYFSNHIKYGIYTFGLDGYEYKFNNCDYFDKNSIINEDNSGVTLIDNNYSFLSNSIDIKPIDRIARYNNILILINSESIKFWNIDTKKLKKVITHENLPSSYSGYNQTAIKNKYEIVYEANSKYIIFKFDYIRLCVYNIELEKFVFTSNNYEIKYLNIFEENNSLLIQNKENMIFLLDLNSLNVKYSIDCNKVKFKYIPEINKIASIEYNKLVIYDPLTHKKIKTNISIISSREDFEDFIIYEVSLDKKFMIICYNDIAGDNFIKFDLESYRIISDNKNLLDEAKIRFYSIEEMKFISDSTLKITLDYDCYKDEVFLNLKENSYYDTRASLKGNLGDKLSYKNYNFENMYSYVQISDSNNVERKYFIYNFDNDIIFIDENGYFSVSNKSIMSNCIRISDSDIGIRQLNEKEYKEFCIDELYADFNNILINKFQYENKINFNSKTEYKPFKLDTNFIEKDAWDDVDDEIPF